MWDFNLCQAAVKVLDDCWNELKAKQDNSIALSQLCYLTVAREQHSSTSQSLVAMPNDLSMHNLGFQKRPLFPKHFRYNLHAADKVRENHMIAPKLAQQYSHLAKLGHGFQLRCFVVPPEKFPMDRKETTFGDDAISSFS
ncbi:hypothetical protein WISP_91544 [Willisornis vidua]|uniref:Uncharacterized protein n=1 Tax=Willisornis vidua TaxID=1566151 RepID=A0ABQ9D6D7_9PASS|nr:hypothetical protein WISP_91544 [Willisornis vidua]